MHQRQGPQRRQQQQRERYPAADAGSQWRTFSVQQEATSLSLKRLVQHAVYMRAKNQVSGLKTTNTPRGTNCTVRQESDVGGARRGQGQIDQVPTAGTRASWPGYPRTKYAPSDLPRSISHGLRAVAFPTDLKKFKPLAQRTQRRRRGSRRHPKAEDKKYDQGTLTLAASTSRKCGYTREAGKNRIGHKTKPS